MERLDLRISEFTRRTRSVLVRHAETGLDRGLEPGEQIEVSDGSSRWLATVRDIDFELADTLYRLELGPVSTVPQPIDAGPLQTADVVALLRDLASTQSERATRSLGAGQVGRAQA